MPIVEQRTNNVISKDNISGYDNTTTVNSISARVEQVESAIDSAGISSSLFSTNEHKLLRIIRAMISKAICCIKPQVGAVFQAENAEVNFDVGAGADVPINWQDITISSRFINYKNGVIRPMMKGYYKVVAKLYDTYPSQPATYQILNVNGNDGSNGAAEIDRYMGAGCDLGGDEKVVYCDGANDTITVSIYNAGVATNRYRVIIGHQHISRVTVTYVGNEESGTLTI